jgi:uncharacterized protein
MKPSLALDGRREEIRRIVAANRGLNPRVFGSALRSEDTDESDLDLLIDPAEGMTLFDMACNSQPPPRPELATGGPPTHCA